MPRITILNKRTIISRLKKMMLAGTAILGACGLYWTGVRVGNNAYFMFTREAVLQKIESERPLGEELKVLGSKLATLKGRRYFTDITETLEKLYTDALAPYKARAISEMREGSFISATEIFTSTAAALQLPENVMAKELKDFAYEFEKNITDTIDDYLEDNDFAGAKAEIEMLEGSQYAKPLIPALEEKVSKITPEELIKKADGMHDDNAALKVYEKAREGFRYLKQPTREAERKIALTHARLYAKGTPDELVEDNGREVMIYLQHNPDDTALKEMFIEGMNKVARVGGGSHFLILHLAEILKASGNDEEINERIVIHSRLYAEAAKHVGPEEAEALQRIAQVLKPNEENARMYLTAAKNAETLKDKVRMLNIAFVYASELPESGAKKEIAETYIRLSLSADSESATKYLLLAGQLLGRQSNISALELITMKEATAEAEEPTLSRNNQILLKMLELLYTAEKGELEWRHAQMNYQKEGHNETRAAYGIVQQMHQNTEDRRKELDTQYSELKEMIKGQKQE